MGKKSRTTQVTQIDVWRERMPENNQMSEIPLRSPNKNIHYGGRTFVAGRPMMVVAHGNKKDSMTPEEVLGDIYGRPIESIDIKFKDEAVRKTS